MNTLFSPWALIVCIMMSGCEAGSRYNETVIPTFNFEKTIEFRQKLSDYGLFAGELANLQPAEGVHVLELSSVLFTDFAHKLRTAKLPENTQITLEGSENLVFPNGTILTKTFYYINDEQNPHLGKNIIETRLLIKNDDKWNAATYVWNDAQNDASLEESGLRKSIAWQDHTGEKLGTSYAVPSSNDCLTCHQHNNRVVPLGPTVRNLNRQVMQDNQSSNQLHSLQSMGALYSFAIDEQVRMVDYNDTTASLENRARAYLALNCAHCHQPAGWEEATERQFDFRYATSLRRSGILYSEDKITRALQSGDMPLTGTTMLDHDGMDIVIEYLSELSR